MNLPSSIFSDITISLDTIRHSPLVLYGAGGNAKRILPELRGAGIQIDCFCDRDPEKQKKPHLGLPVIAPELVAEQFPDRPFFVYITLAEPLRFTVQEELIDKNIFTKEQIVNYRPVSWLKSCHRIENEMFLLHEGLSCCCDYFPGAKERFRLPVTQDYGQTVSNYFEMVDSLRQMNQQPDAPCGNCICMIEQYWPLNPKITNLGISHFIPCQMNCSYCNLGNSAHLLKTGDYQKYDGMDFVQYLADQKLLASDLCIGYGGGEITLNPEKDRIIEFMSHYGTTNIFYSNCADHLSAFAQMDPAIKETFHICPSLDCGTPETFRKIKGKDLFHKFLTSLAWYREHDIEVQLKYIVTTENSNPKDLEGFIEICRKYNVSKIIISSNYYEHEDNYQPYVVDSAFRLITLAKLYQIDYSVASFFIGRGNNCQLNERLAQQL